MPSPTARTAAAALFPQRHRLGAHRVPHSELPPMGGLPENMGALGELETAYENSGRGIFYDDDGCEFAEEWSQEARAVVEKYLPEHAAGFCGALAVCGAR